MSAAETTRASQPVRKTAGLSTGFGVLGCRLGLTESHRGRVWRYFEPVLQNLGLLPGLDRLALFRNGLTRLLRFI
jgi:hypothetical protein